jgi:hypothetical protein
MPHFTSAEDAVQLLRIGSIRVYSHLVQIVKTLRVLQQAGLLSDIVVPVTRPGKVTSSTRISSAPLVTLTRQLRETEDVAPER